MNTASEASKVWKPGIAPVAVVMIALNEGHRMRGVLENLSGWAQEVFLVDSFSQDDTIDIALSYGVHVVQRRFRGFGDQWNFALRELPVTAPWTMKLDPDERLGDELKDEIIAVCTSGHHDALRAKIRLFFMGRALPIRLNLVRLWRTGRAQFSNVLANEHATVDGPIGQLRSDIHHHDSPDLEHWLDKQNRYTTLEAVRMYRGDALAAKPRLFGSALERRMWLKKNFYRLPFRYAALFAYHYLVQGAWRAGLPGYIWARLRADVMRLIEYKYEEIRLTGRIPVERPAGPGQPDPRVPQFE